MDNKSPPFIVRQSAGGLGDCLDGLYAVFGAMPRYPNIVYSLPTGNHPWVRLFCDVGLIPFSSHGIDINAGYGIECRAKGKGQKRVDRYCRNLGVQPIKPQLKDREKLTEAGRQWQGYIGLAPFSAYNNRSWPRANAQEFVRLCRDNNQPVVLIHNRGADGFDCPILNGSAADVTAGVLNCRAIVGADSGISHLSSLLGVRTLVLCGPTDTAAIYYEPVEEVLSEMHCRSCWWAGPNFQPACDKIGCAALGSIAAERVWKLVSLSSRLIASRDTSLSMVHRR